MRISDWSSDVFSSDLRRARRGAEGAARRYRRAHAGDADAERRAADRHAARLGSGPINCASEASKWRRYRVRVAAAGSIATRKAARTQDRSHFGVPPIKREAGFDRFCPWRRRQVLKYRHISAPCLLALSKIASNLTRKSVV